MMHSFERLLVELCAPTLAGLKVGSLFRYQRQGDDDIDELVQLWDDRLLKKGLRVFIIRSLEDYALIYVFRPSLLERVLKSNEVNCFLRDYGFCSAGDWEKCLGQLQCRFCESRSFPHEIGVFLGYPVDDVRGFIEQRGQNYSLCGPWKVYGDCHSAACLFKRYRMCYHVFKERFDNGANILNLTVVT